jgi:ATP-binding cassette, subfamily C (CFTR/MRP), member 1
MSTDVERICDTWLDIHDLWGSTIEAAIALWLLQRQLGIAFISPAFIACGEVSETATLGPDHIC